jgi:hypothetical protein
MCLLAVGIAFGQRTEGPQPPVVDPGGPNKPPSDAVVLFNGRDNSGWTTLDDAREPSRPGSGKYQHQGAPSKCTVADGVMTCRTGAGDIQTTEKFRDAQIHLEFNIVPPKPDEKGWARGNSGVILLNRYEVQILDSYQSDMGGGESCAGHSGYGPLVNACRRPGEWQSYDIVFHAPVCAPDGSVQTPGSLTVLHNGVLVQDHVSVRGRGCVSEEGPLVLQDHSRYVGRKIGLAPGVTGPAPDTTLKFRNIWMRRLTQ